MTEALPHILLIDDEAPIVRVLTSALGAAGYHVSSAGAGAEALSMVAQAPPDVIVLDLGLPDMDGKEVIAKLREWTHAPIVVLSARDDENERIAALDEGADDYVVKPFHMGELQARVRAALRHAARRGHQSVFSVLDLVVDFEKRTVKLGGEDIKLPKKEYDLLHTLAQHAGQVVTHKQLLLAGWGGSVADTQFVRVYIGQLRQKLERDPSAPRLILTEPGVGYRLVDE